MCLGSVIKLSWHLIALRREFMRSGLASDTSSCNLTSNMRISWYHINIHERTLSQWNRMLQFHYGQVLMCSLLINMLLTWLCERRTGREGIPVLKSVIRATATSCHWATAASLKRTICALVMVIIFIMKKVFPYVNVQSCAITPHMAV